jgi:hypothetical protein
MNRFLPRLGWTALVLLVLLVASLVLARVLFARYLRSEAFRRTLGEGAANALHASRADFTPLDFDGSLVYADKFHATGSDGGIFSAIDADQLRADFDWHGILRHTVQIDELAIQRLNVQAPIGGGASEPASSNNPEWVQQQAGQGHEGWKVDLRKAVIDEANWQWSDDATAGVAGTALTLTPDGQNAWIIDAQGGTLNQPGWPELDIETASLRWKSPTLFINSGSLRNGTSRISVNGSVEARQSVDLQVKLDGVDVQPLLTPDWRERLTGRLTGEANIHASLGGEAPSRDVRVSGSASLIEGQLTALPILDEIGTFTQTERFRRLELTRASAVFTSTPGRVEVRDLVLEAEGLIRVEGAYTVENGEIAGKFQVGLTPATLQWIPGSEEEIFTDSRGGYLWTAMKLSGPATHPVDDLTPRLIAAAGNQVIKGAAGTVQKAAEGVLNLLLH